MAEEKKLTEKEKEYLLFHLLDGNPYYHAYWWVDNFGYPQGQVDILVELAEKFMNEVKI